MYNSIISLFNFQNFRSLTYQRQPNIILPMKYLLNIIYFILLLLFSPVAIYRCIAHKRYRKGFKDRLGLISKKKTGKKCIWIHAVSVGEVNATRTIIDRLAKNLDNYDIVISTTTDTGFKQASKLYAGNYKIFYYPFDFSFTVAKAIKNLNPALLLFVELEVWPNIISIASKKNIPVMVANGRISDKSFPKYLRIKKLISGTFSKLAIVLTQTPEYRQRFIALGCKPENVVVSGSLKYDTAQVADKLAKTDSLISQFDTSSSTIWVAGGTGTDEEKLLLGTYKKLKQNYENLKLVLVPRKPERFNEVAQLITASDFSFIKYSDYKNAENKASKDDYDIILVNTMGDLRNFYSIADIVFIGRSLVPMGGSDMIESAALAKPTIFGPHTFNFKQTVHALLAEGGAIQVKDTDHLYRTIASFIENPEHAQKIARTGQTVIINNKGATDKTVQAIIDILNRWP